MTDEKRKRILSGIKPTGKTHIGNYFGAMRQWLELQNKGIYDPIFMIADYHTLNFVQNRQEMIDLTFNMTVDYLAVGLDPKEAIIFKQSDISAHTELTWIFDTLVTVPYLERAHAYKDAEAKGVEVSAGTFNYPVLMAADILLYNTDIVPVGADQKQHIEYARDIAGKFNHTFGETFKLPEEMIIKDVAVVPGIDGRKMSKSYGNTIPLFASRSEIEKLVLSIVTDSSEGIPQNVYAIHSLIKDKKELDSLYEQHTGKYKALKDALIEDLDAFIKPLRDKRETLANDKITVAHVLLEGKERANAIASETLKKAKKAIGVLE